MSQENLEIVGRSIEERVALAMPISVVRLVLAGVARLPPGSHLRRRLLKRTVALGHERASWDDFEFLLLAFEPDVQFWLFGELVRASGVAERYHGHEGFIDAWRGLREDLDDMRVQPEQIIDLGDRLAIRVTIVARGRTSGAETTTTSGYIYYLSPRGMVARVEYYWGWEEALDALNDHGEAFKAAGLSE